MLARTRVRNMGITLIRVYWVKTREFTARRKIGRIAQAKGKSTTFRDGMTATPMPFVTYSVEWGWAVHLCAPVLNVSWPPAHRV